MNGRTTITQDNLDWSVLLVYAQNHQVCGIVYHQCKSFLPLEALNILSLKNASELFYYSNRIKLFEKVRNAFTAERIEFYTVKGLNVAAFYPVPALRTMGDCDIVVHPEDKERAHAVMTAMGFENRLKEDMEWMYFKNGMEFEIHDHLLYDELGNTRSSRDYVGFAWDHAKPVGEGTQYELDWSFHFLFLLLHLKKHLVHSGIGFRQFMDLDVVIRQRRLDWKWLEKTLSDLELWRFAQVCFSLLKRWFDTPFPIELERLEDVFFEEATAKVFANGIFGFNDEKNKENRSLNSITQRSGPRWLVRVKSIIGSVFPAYRFMRYVPHYAFLNNRPWLLPVAWVYRFYRSVRYRMGENGKRMVNNALISDDRLDEREQELAKWGLSQS